ncbi:unnamed protein product [Caenorhabditis brenneri]
MTMYLLSDDLTLYPVITTGDDYQESLSYANNNNDNPTPDSLSPEPDKDAKLLRKSRIDQERLALMTEVEMKKLEDNRLAARKSAKKKMMRQKLLFKAVEELKIELKLCEGITEYLKDLLERRYAYEIWPAFGWNSPYNTPQDFSAILEFYMTEKRNAPEPEQHQIIRSDLLKELEAFQFKFAKAPPPDLKSGTKGSKKSRGKLTLQEAQNKVQEWDLCCAVSREKSIGAQFCEFAVVLNDFLRQLNQYLLPEKVAYDRPMEPIRYPPRA